MAEAVTAVIEVARLTYNEGKTGNKVANAPAENGTPTTAWTDFLQTEIRVPVRHSMMELGFTPTFYQFVDTIIEVKIAIKITRERSYSVTRTNKSQSAARQASGRVRWWKGSASGQSSSTVSTSQVDATYSGKYSYSAEGASILRTKIVPVPPPAVLEDRIRSYMETEEQRRVDQIEAKKLEVQGGTTGGS